MRTLLVLVLLVASLAVPARAEVIYTAEPEVVATHAEIVVRAHVDLETRRITVLEVYRGAASGTLEVRNLCDFTDEGRRPDARKPTTEAVLFLDEVDGRYHLVHTSSPAWIRPHAAILYLTPEDEVLAYGQLLSGVLQLMPRGGLTRKGLETLLRVWLDAPRTPRFERPSLPADDAKRVYDLVDPFVDLHRREVVTEPHRTHLTLMLDGLAGLVTEADGELRRRAVEALLVLAEQLGVDQNRRGLTEARLIALLDAVGDEPFVEACLAEIGSPAVSASRETAAKLLQRIGGEPREEAKALLLEILREHDGTLATRAYFALRHLGFPAEAERALR